MPRTPDQQMRTVEALIWRLGGSYTRTTHLYYEDFIKVGCEALEIKVNSYAQGNIHIGTGVYRRGVMGWSLDLYNAPMIFGEGIGCLLLLVLHIRKADINIPVQQVLRDPDVRWMYDPGSSQVYL
jgi:hypothetical protein